MAAEFTGTDQGFPNTRALNELDWCPRVDFDTGMRRVKTWLQEERFLKDDDVASSG
jgi:hypothetical protein